MGTAIKWRYHGLDMRTDPKTAWIIQELIHERRPERIIHIGDNTPGMAAWLCDCMRADLIHPFVIEISDEKMSRHLNEWTGIVWIDGALDVATFNRIAPMVGCPTMLIVNRDLTEEQKHKWYPLVTAGQFLIDSNKNGGLVPNGFKSVIVDSESMNAFQRSAI